MADSILDIKDILNEYSRDIQEGIIEAANKVGELGVKKLQANSPKKTGKYAKSWSLKKESGSTYVHNTIHNKQYYRLTHLLERPHVIRNKYGVWGTYYPKRKHIEPEEQIVNQDFKNAVKRVIQNGG